MNRRSLILTGIVLLLAMGATAQTQWPADDGATAYALYELPTTDAAPTDAPTAGVTIPSWANRVVMECRDGDVKFMYNLTPTATVGVTCTAGTIIVWPFFDMMLFRSIQFYGVEADSKVFLLYSRASREQ